MTESNMQDSASGVVVEQGATGAAAPEPGAAELAPVANAEAAKEGKARKAKLPRAKAKLRARKAKAAEQQGMPKPAGKQGPGRQLVRDSFTMSKDEHRALDQLKKRAMVLEREVRKGDLLRAGLQMLGALPDDAFLRALEAVPALKPGRPRADAEAASAEAHGGE